MTPRQRLSATVEAPLLDAARHAVAEGRAESVSAWVNDALRRQAEHDRGLKALGEFIRGYEAQHGAITDEEIRDAQSHYRERTVTVRPPSSAKRRAAPRRTKGAA
ncbi:MAG: hypothetical protein KGJ98_03570 [Chloroflexota bacterium]|nr:hypothetical protein [Chloroflexota bacterium]MDE3101293.1 hypothetical protein [Chloroflexota bacterium]